MGDVRVNPTPKMLREALCAAQSALSERARDGIDVRRTRHWIADISALIEQIDIHRPLGPDGKHGDGALCTATCGCYAWRPYTLTL